MVHERAHCRDEAANHQLPVAIFTHLSSEECSSLMQYWMQICCSAGSVILNALATAHMLTQQGLHPLWTSTVKSSLFTHVHSSPLSLTARLHRFWANHSRYINNGQTFSGQTSYIIILLLSFHFLWSLTP